MPLRVLLVEDSEDDALLVLRALRCGGYDPAFERVETAAAMKLMLEQRKWDVVLSDYYMPSFDAPAALAVLQESGLDLPFVIVSGAVGEETAVEAMRAGANDYVKKGNLARLVPAIERELGDAEVRRQRRRAEKALRASEERYCEQVHQMQQIIGTVPEGVLLLDADLHILLANSVAREYLPVFADAQVGDTLSALGNRPLADVLVPPPRGLWHEVEVDDAGRHWTFELIARPVGSNARGEGWVVVIRDVTEAREVQQSIQRQERLAAVGQLAAGIAHDFRNVLTPILLYSDLLAKAPDMPPQYRKRLDTICQQGNRATALIRQILDFSRQSVMERRCLNLLSFVREMEGMLARVLPENVHIHLSCDSGSYFVNADPTCMQQVIMNLALNARDAMPDGGDLRFELSRLRLGPGDGPPCHSMAAGEWVRMAIADTGAGISADVLPHIFEPFFTTKPDGQGTGLGLAQVHGVVEQHGGYVRVESQMGRGTVFSIYLPVLSQLQSSSYAQEDPVLVAGHGEAILVVEDDAAIREALRNSLQQLNYRVLETCDGHQALEVCRSGEKIDLVLTDMVMPGMGGKELIENLREVAPHLRVVAMTGYVLADALRQLKATGPLEVICKPLDVSTLSSVIRQVLDARDLAVMETGERECTGSTIPTRCH